MSLPVPVTTPDAPQTRADRRREHGGPQNSSRFRGDIEGLRALAVLLVLIYHAGVTGLSGGFIGVDIFFVVSGFVITNQLLREVESTGHLSLLGFYGRRAKRLLPAASVVVLVTAVMAWLLVNRVQWQQIGGDLVGAAVYVVNWVFSNRAVDYLAEDVDPSPVLHFWSLAVEEQFYLVWPLIILGLILFLRRRTVRAAGPQGLAEGTVVVPQRAHLAIGLLVLIVVPSLIFSVVYTVISPAQAFFITPTRLWELGVGALVALGSGVFLAWRPTRGALVGWVGLIVLLASAFLVSTATPWPGIAAALPVLGTAAVIAGGFASKEAGPARLLALRPLVWIGGLSYSLYLWHWPLLRFWEWSYGPPSLTQGLLIVAASFLPAWLSYKLIESPIRHAKSLNLSPRYALSVGVNFTFVALVAGLLLTQLGSAGTAAGRPTGASWSSGDSASSTADPGGGSGGGTTDGDPSADPGGQDGDGAGGVPALPLPSIEGPDDEPFFDQVTPNPLKATEDVPDLYASGCQSTLKQAEVKLCELGDPEGETVLAVVGDSKVGQWAPAVDLIAKEQGWRVHLYTKSACSFTSATTTSGGEVYTDCQTWSAEVLDRLLTDERPDAVVTSGIRRYGLDDAGKQSETALVDGMADYWGQLGEAGVPVIALSDTPQPMDSDIGTPYECAADHPDDAAAACTWASDDGIGSPPLKAAVEQVETASYIDMNPWVCPEGTCAAVYRNVLTYRQGSHITATLAEVLAEPLASYLVPLVDAAASD